MDVNVRRMGNVIIVELAGNLDLYNASHIRQVMVDATSRRAAQVIVNMRNTCFIDSSGLAALVQGLKLARENQGNLCLCNLQSSVRMIFELTRFDKVFEIFVNEESAVQATASPA